MSRCLRVMWPITCSTISNMRYKGRVGGGGEVHFRFLTHRMMREWHCEAAAMVRTSWAQMCCIVPLDFAGPFLYTEKGP